jgi:hypothetical protein
MVFVFLMDAAITAEQLLVVGHLLDAALLLWGLLLDLTELLFQFVGEVIVFRLVRAI